MRLNERHRLILETMADGSVWSPSVLARHLGLRADLLIDTMRGLYRNGTLARSVNGSRQNPVYCLPEFAAKLPSSPEPHTVAREDEPTPTYAHSKTAINLERIRHSASVWTWGQARKPEIPEPDTYQRGMWDAAEQVLNASYEAKRRGEISHSAKLLGLARRIRERARA